LGCVEEVEGSPLWDGGLVGLCWLIAGRQGAGWWWWWCWEGRGGLVDELLAPWLHLRRRLGGSLWVDLGVLRHC
jgi:hypothetical protein